MKLGLTGEGSFINALNQLGVQPLPAKAAYRMAKILKKIEKENIHYNKTRQEIIKRFADLDEKGEAKIKNDQFKSVIFKNEKDEADCKKELQDLYDIEIQIDQIRMSQIPDDYKLSPQTLAVLEPLIEDEDAPAVLPSKFPKPGKTAPVEKAH